MGVFVVMRQLCVLIVVTQTCLMMAAHRAACTCTHMHMNAHTCARTQVHVTLETQ